MGVQISQKSKVNQPYQARQPWQSNSLEQNSSFTNLGLWSHGFWGSDLLCEHALKSKYKRENEIFSLHCGPESCNQRQ